MFKAEDLQKFKAFQMIVKRGDFGLKGEAVVMTASLFLWFDSLEKMIKEDIQPKQEVKVEEVKKVTKKLKD